MFKAEIPGTYSEKIIVTVAKWDGVSKVGKESQFDQV